MAEDNKKGITVKVDADLHAQIKEYIESRGMTMADFITAACDGFLHPIIQEKEEKQVENMRTVAFQVPESLFQRIKDYLHRNNMTQRQFLLGLIENELERDQTQREAAVEPVSAESEEADEVTEQAAEPAVAGGVPAVEEQSEEHSEEAAVAVGRIDFLGSDGQVGESIEYTNAEKFREDIQEESSHGAPMVVSVYRQEDGNTISADFVLDLDTPLKGFQIVDNPHLSVGAEQMDNITGQQAADTNAVNESAEVAEDQAEDVAPEAAESDDHIIDAVFAPWDVQEQTEETEDEAEEEYQDFSMGM